MHEIMASSDHIRFTSSAFLLGWWVSWLAWCRLVFLGSDFSIESSQLIVCCKFKLLASRNLKNVNDANVPVAFLDAPHRALQGQSVLTHNDCEALVRGAGQTERHGAGMADDRFFSAGAGWWNTGGIPDAHL